MGIRNELALFAGAGGGLLATKWMLGWRTVCYVERDEYCVKVIQARIRDRLLDDAPIWDDARTFDGRPWRGCVDIITAGFPCQPFSTAGDRKADEDDRNLWPDTIRIICQVRPRFALLENVPGLLSVTGNNDRKYFGRILGDLAESGYDARWRMLSAQEVGAPHKRDRLWIVAHSDGLGESQPQGGERQERGWAGDCSQEISYAVRKRRDVQKTSGPPRAVANPDRAGSLFPRTIGGRQKHPSPQSSGYGREWWHAEPDVGRVANGVAHRVDRLRAIGNGQVPAVAAVVWSLLTLES